MLWRDGTKMDLERDRVYCLKSYAYLRPYIPTFQEVNDIAVSMAARGVHVLEWEWACKIHLGDRK